MKSSVLYFDGERIDPASGNYFPGQGYRFYSSVLMRFIQPDSRSPFGEGGTHTYAWCQGDPVNRSDPSGHMSWQTGVGVLLSSIGLITACISAGVSMAIAEGIGFSLIFASTPVAVNLSAALTIAADVTGIASAALEKDHTRLSSTLSWVAFGTSLAVLGAALAPGCLRAISQLRQDTLALQRRLALIKEHGLGGKGSKVLPPAGPVRPVQKLPDDNPGGNTYLYRGIRHGHPQEAHALCGRVMPGDPRGDVTLYEHNAGKVLASPYTSWTRDPDMARRFAGEAGIVMRVQTGAPLPGEQWSWVISHDRYWEQEVLMKGIRTSGVEVFLP